jgi:hypothetical protein
LVSVFWRGDGDGLALSGITTSVIGALKRGLAPIEHELGIHVCGGRGRHSRRTPDELISIGDRVGFDGAELARTSRLVAKVDCAAVQDGFDLYLHGFIVTDDAKWAVVQQGMNEQRRQARRYHWLSEGLKDFVDEPHSAIEGQPQGEVINLTHHRAAGSRSAQLELLLSSGPDRIADELAALTDRNENHSLAAQPLLPHLVMPRHHDVRAGDVVMRRLRGSLAAAASSGPGISESFCWFLVSVHAQFVPWLWSLKSYTARPVGSLIRPGSPLPMGERIVTHFLYRFACTTRLFKY